MSIEARTELNTMLAPEGFKVTLVTSLLGGWCAIWYWGKETSFAGGATIQEVADSCRRQVFGGL